MNDHKLYRKVVDSSVNYNTFYVKRFSATYSMDGTRKSFKGAIKIVRDSVIWISLSDPIIGIEGARILVTPDSVKFIDRLKKKYYVGTFSYLNRELGLDLDFHALQSILTNSIFQYSKSDNRPFTRNFRGKIWDGDYIFISTQDKKIQRKIKKQKIRKLYGTIYQRIAIDPILFRITGVMVKQFESLRRFSVEYSDFKDFGSQKFPQQLNLEVEEAKHLLTCKVKYSKITYNEKLRLSFKISDKYQRISQ